MPRMRCPRCSTIVDVTAGAAPVCTACGFGSAARAAAPAAPPASPAPAPVAAAPVAAGAAPAAGRRTGVVVAIVVAAVLVAGALGAAGWYLLRGGDANPLTQQEAESRLTAALESMPGGLSGDGVAEDLRAMTLTTQGGAGGEDLGGFGGGDVSVEVEWGRDGVTRLEMASGGGAISFAITLYCGPQGMLMVLGEESYGSRPSTGGQDACDDLEGEKGLGNEGLAPVPADNFSAQDADITIHSDGSLTAVVEPEEGGTATIDVDARGRLDRIEFEDPDTPGMTVTMEFEYGSRRAIDVPEADHLIPATLETEETFDAATHTLTVAVTGSPEEPLRSELEVRVLDGFGGDVVQAFPLSQSSASAQGINYTFNDVDSDGRLSAGDFFTLQNPAWDYSFDAAHVVYDTLADGEVNSSPMGAPGPGLAWLALGILAMAVAMRRRR